MTQFKTVVWLDGPIVPPLTDLWSGVEIDLITDKKLRGDYKMVTPSELLKIRQLSESGKVDLFVIGNNLGTGFKKAEAVVPQARDKVIILYNSLNLDEIEAYRKLGFKRIVCRTDFGIKDVAKALGIK